MPVTILPTPNSFTFIQRLFSFVLQLSFWHPILLFLLQPFSLHSAWLLALFSRLPLSLSSSFLPPPFVMLRCAFRWPPSVFILDAHFACLVFSALFQWVLCPHRDKCGYQNHLLPIILCLTDQAPFGYKLATPCSRHEGAFLYEWFPTAILFSDWGHVRSVCRASSSSHWGGARTLTRPFFQLELFYLFYL